MNSLYMLAFIGLMAVAANGDIFSLPSLPPMRAPFVRARRDVGCGHSFNEKNGQMEQNCPNKYDVQEEFGDFTVQKNQRN